MFEKLKLFLRPIKRWFFFHVIWPLSVNEIPEFKVMDSIETLKYILKSGRSFVRFGDGELDIIFGNKPPQYQENAPMLASDLRQILTQPKDGLLICIPEVFNLKKWHCLMMKANIFGNDSFLLTGYSYYGSESPIISMALHR